MLVEHRIQYKLLESMLIWETSLTGDPGNHLNTKPLTYYKTIYNYGVDFSATQLKH